MADQIVSLTTAPNQTFTVQLVIDNKPLTLNLALSFSTMSGWWNMQIADVIGNVLVASVPLITGWYPSANVLGQYGYLQIGAVYILNTGNVNNDYPDANTLTNFSLLWGDTAL